MKERKLKYRFHDPNPADVTADYILKLFIEVNAPKVEAALRLASLSPAPVGQSSKGAGRESA